MTKLMAVTPMVERNMARMSLSQLELLYERRWQAAEYRLLHEYIGLCIDHLRAYKSE